MVAKGAIALAVDGGLVFGLAHWGTEFWVHCKEHVREGGAEEGAINVLVPRCTRRKDVVAPRAKQFDGKVARLV